MHNWNIKAMVPLDIELNQLVLVYNAELVLQPVMEPLHLHVCLHIIYRNLVVYLVAMVAPHVLVHHNAQYANLDSI